LAASVGELDAVAPDFTPALDVANGGLLCALPALLAVGLLEGVERHLQLPKGHYGLDSLLLLLAFMLLARLESIESLRDSARASGAICWAWTGSPSACVCAPRPTTGSTPWTANPCSSSTKWSIRG
jgi:hypothetical protein